MAGISELMKNVSLQNMSKIGDEEVKEDELLVVFYEDDVGRGDCNRAVKIAGSLMQLDAVLTYGDRQVDRISRMKLVESYAR